VRHSRQGVDVSNARQDIDIGVLVPMRNRNHAGTDVRINVRRADYLASFSANDHLLTVRYSGGSRIVRMKQHVSRRS
jgi:hypothetical protein